MKRSLTPDDILDYFNKANTVKLRGLYRKEYVIDRISVDHTREKLSYVLHEAGNDELIVLSNVVAACEYGGDVFIKTEDFVYTLVQLANIEVAEDLGFYPQEEMLEEDDNFRLMWRRAMAIESYINNRLFGLQLFCKERDYKVRCLLDATLNLDGYDDTEDGECSEYAFVGYYYYYNLYVAGVVVEIPVTVSNDEAFTYLTEGLIKKLPWSM